MPDELYILVINPGSTSTKLAIFQNQLEIRTETLKHDFVTLSQYPSVISQKEFRLHILESFLGQNSKDLQSLDAVVGRGGLLKPISSGTYGVNEMMLEDLQQARYGEHASNLGAILADAIARKAHCPAFIVDPVVVDEMELVARYSGHPLITRKSIFHALNQKSTARKASDQIGKSYEQCRLIVVHLGGGISIGAHQNGRVIDVNNALDGDGPFSPERAGGLPTGDLIGLCFSGKYKEKTLRHMFVGEGGLNAYLGTHDLQEIKRKYKHHQKEAEIVLQAMTYQICKEIGAMGAVLQGRIDAIVITGGMAFSEELVTAIQNQVAWIAPVIVIPGETEMEALAQGAYRVLIGEEEAKVYGEKSKESRINNQEIRIKK